MSKKLIVQIVQHLRPGGLEVLALELQRFLEKDYDVQIISLEDHPSDALHAWDRLKPLADRLHFIEKPPGISLKAILRMAFLFRKLQPHAVHTHHIGPLLYGGLAARMAHVPQLVHTEHDAWHLHDEKEARLQKRLMRWLKPVMIADAQIVADELLRVDPGSAPIVINNGIDTEKFSPGDKQTARKALGMPEGVRLIGCAARLEEVKGHRHLLSALQLMDKDIHVSLAGIGSQEGPLKELARRLGIEARVQFLGRVDDMTSFYRASDIFCLPSLHEGMPLSPLEAQSCGCLAVVTDTGGAKETIDPETGGLAKPGDPEDLARALAEAFGREAGDSPREFVVRTADLAAVSQRYAEILTRD